MKRGLDHRIVGFYASCKLVAVETALFICFIFELARFMRWLWRS
jgi:hypothetical protein